MDRIPERWWFAISGVLAVVLIVVGWQVFAGGDDSGDATGLNEPSSSTSPTSTSSPEPSESATPDRDAWRSKFTDKQLSEFDAAHRDWERFGELMEAYEREPGDPDKVRAIYERYTYNATALTESYIANYVQGGVRQLERPTPLYVTGRKIEVNKKGSLVEFDQCYDYTTLDLRRDGKPIKGAAPTKNDTAIIRVQMAYQLATDTAEGGWRVFTSKVVDKPCA